VQIPQVYTIEETAELLKVSPKNILDEIEAGRLEAFRIGTEWRTTDKSISEFISTGGSQAQVPMPAKQGFSNTALERAETFSYTWPGGTVEEYTQAYEGTVKVDDTQVAAKIGIGERHAAGKLRKRIVVFLDGRPTVEFAGVDDFDKSGLVASVITLRNRKRLRPGQRVPDEYKLFRLVRYNTVVTGPHAMSAMAVMASINDLDTMVSHAVIRAMLRDQR
jgi:excisionase family DNA binding protein